MNGTHLSLFVVTLGAALLTGCPGADDTPTGSDPCGGPSPEERAQNQVIFDGLKKSCEGCHSAGSRGYFASIGAFESLLAYDARLVKPGDPDNSQFIKLLEGTAPGAYPKMPTDVAYVDQVQAGKATLPMQTIRDWVTNLKSHSRDPLPSIAARRVTRVSAADALRGLYQQLGLSDADFFKPAGNFSIEHKTAQDDSLYPMSSYDAIPAPYEAVSADRFATLGGGSAMYQKKTDGTVTPSFAGSIAQVAQRWCALSLDKPNNTALLPAGASITTGSMEPAKVKAVLTAWFLHFHAVEAKPADVDFVFNSVFVPLEKGKDARTGYIGSCSYFIRHPDWIFY
jgi:hypothetical protein